MTALPYYGISHPASPAPSDPSRSDLQDVSVSPMRLIGSIVLPVLHALSAMPLEMIMAEQVSLFSITVRYYISTVIVQ